MKRKWWVILAAMGAGLAAWLWWGGETRLLRETELGPASILGFAPDGRLAVLSAGELAMIDAAGDVELVPSNVRPAYGEILVGTNGFVFSFNGPGPGGGVTRIDWSGKELWAFVTNGPVGIPAADAAGSVYFYGPNWMVYVVDRAGAVLWTKHYGSAAAGMRFFAPALAADGRVALVGGTNGLIMLDRNGAELWREAGLGTGINESSATFLEGGDLLMCDHWTVRRYDPIGRVIWSLTLPDVVGRTSSSSYLNARPIIAADGTIYCLGEDQVFALNPDGKLLWQHSFSSAARKGWQPHWVSEWATFTPQGDLVVIAGDRESIVGTAAPGVITTLAQLARNERVVCLGRDGLQKWSQSIPSAFTWSFPLNKVALEVMWKSRLGLRNTKHLRSLVTAPDGTIYLSGFVNGKTKIYAIRGDEPKP